MAWDIFFDCVWLILANVLVVLAVMIAKLVIKLSRPYSIEEHRNHLLAFCENHKQMNQFIADGHRIQQAKRLMLQRREYVDRLLLHMLETSSVGSSVKDDQSHVSSFEESIERN